MRIDRANDIYWLGPGSILSNQKRGDGLVNNLMLIVPIRKECYEERPDRLKPARSHTAYHDKEAGLDIHMSIPQVRFCNIDPRKRDSLESASRERSSYQLGDGSGSGRWGAMSSRNVECTWTRTLTTDRCARWWLKRSTAPAGERRRVG